MSETTEAAPASADATNTPSLTEWGQVTASGTRIDMMLDIETLSTAQDALVLSVGAVLFDPYGAPGSIIETMHVPLVLDQKGSMTNLDTVMWWFGQTEAAKAMVQLRKDVALHTPRQMFTAMADMLARNTPASGRRVTKVWGNSVSFDCTILRRLAEREGIDVPWGFRDENCYRTWFAEFKCLDIYVEAAAEIFVAHDALADAKYQAATLQTINQVLRHGHQRAEPHPTNNDPSHH